MAGRRWIVVLAAIPPGMRAATAAVRQAAELTRAGHAVAVVFPDPQAAAAIGRNVFDPARRAPAARAGHARAGPALDRVGAVWDGQRA
jgi:NTE family protein